MGYNQAEAAAGIAVSKVLRLNRNIRLFDISGSNISGNPAREITRALMINSTLKSLHLDSCKIDDYDSRDIGQMLGNNSTL